MPLCTGSGYLDEGQVRVVHGLLVGVIVAEGLHGVEAHPHCGHQHQGDAGQGHVPDTRLVNSQQLCQPHLAKHDLCGFSKVSQSSCWYTARLLGPKSSTSSRQASMYAFSFSIVSLMD